MRCWLAILEDSNRRSFHSQHRQQILTSRAQVKKTQISTDAKILTYIYTIWYSHEYNWTKNHLSIGRNSGYPFQWVQLQMWKFTPDATWKLPDCLTPEWQLNPSPFLKPTLEWKCISNALSFSLKKNKEIKNKIIWMIR